MSGGEGLVSSFPVLVESDGVHAEGEAEEVGGSLRLSLGDEWGILNEVANRYGSWRVRSAGRSCMFVEF